MSNPCPDCEVHEDMTRCQAKLLTGQKITWGGIVAVLGALLALFLSGCGSSLPYDPQCAIDVAQDCVEKMQECKEEVEETDDETD